jgi:starch-binding outer membrane protein, SusD/RagB family
MSQNNKIIMEKLSALSVSILMLTLISATSCSDEFLTREPPGSTSEAIFCNEKGINALIIGTYAMVPGSSLWEVSWGASIQNWTYGSVASDDAYKGSESTDSSPANEIEKWQTRSTNVFILDKWKLTLGMGVFRANQALKIVQKAQKLGNISGVQAGRFSAELRFLRGLFNFEARLIFGDYVPIITEDTPDPEKVSNENADGVFLAHIINDLKFAWENLPETRAEVGRATRYAAMALAARAYLQDLKYVEAKPTSYKAINMN